MKRIELALAIGLLFSIGLTSFGGFAQECDEIRHGALRLHILANSDSDEDQALKLAVRDALLAGTEDLFEATQSKEQAAEAAERHLAEIEQLAGEEIRRQGYAYPVTARMVNRYFETRVYDGFTMPAGRYDAVQVEIGAGDGRNWWCVMFPPMCIPAAEEHNETPLEEQIRSLGEQPRYQPAFAVVEVFESLQQALEGDSDKSPEEPPG